MKNIKNSDNPCFLDVGKIHTDCYQKGIFYQRYNMSVYNLFMDLSTIKDYFQAICSAETQLQQYWPKFSKIPSYSLFKTIATQSQPKLDQAMIRQFIITFNWQALLSSTNLLNNRPSYKVHSLKSEMNPEQLLDYGIQLLIKNWGEQGTMNFQQFSKLVKGQEQLPAKDIEVQFTQKRVFFQLLMKQMQNLIGLESMKKVVYHEYKNLSDLFETLTATNRLQSENIERLFLSFSDRKSKQEIRRICKRAKLPWDFNHFIDTFKKSSQSNKSNEFKVYHSARRTKNEDKSDKFFTTPRKQKFAYGQSSTKLTKLQSYEQSPFQTPKNKKIGSHEPESTKSQTQSYIYVQILAEILQLEEQFNIKCSQLVKRKDFDLELVYERHGKKFEKLLNTRYGVCNFSAFVRFIIPRDYEHRYLSLIRYQSDNSLSSQTQTAIGQLLQAYEQKQLTIKKIWQKCDKQMLVRYFCRPKQEGIENNKLKQIFTSRQTKILLQRLDPHSIGKIYVDALV